MGEIEQNARVTVVGQQALQLLADILDQGGLEHQARVDEIDHRNAVDILQLQMLERGCRHRMSPSRDRSRSARAIRGPESRPVNRRPFLD